MKIRNILFYSMAASLFIFSSCKKFLDIEPQEGIAENQTIIDGASARTAIRGVYNALASNDYYGFTFPTLAYYSGDNIQYVGSQTVNRQLTNHDVKSDLGPVATSWSAIYKTINRANNVLEKVPPLAVNAQFTDAEKNAILAEAHFIRALAYFDLVRTWGGVQLILTSKVPVGKDSGIKRSSVEQTYAQVLSDLDLAETLLPATLNRIRATKKTVWALKARYYLYTKDWQQAETYASKLITDEPGYKLVTPYSAFFANNVRATEESVFELYYSNNLTNNQASQWQPSSRGGVRWTVPSDVFISLINDPLKGGNRSAMVGKVVVSNQDQWYGNMYYRGDASDPVYIIRIAELYLIRAEARAKLGAAQLTGGLTDLNKVRSRAGLTPLTVNTQDALLLAIEDERRLEFAFEPHRWYDLVRTGRAASVLGVTNAQKYVLPIPVGETYVDASLKQNDGY